MLRVHLFGGTAERDAALVMLEQLSGAKSAHKDFLFRRIVWQLQAQREGNLSQRARKRAEQIADDADLRVGGAQGFWSWPGSASPAAGSSQLFGFAGICIRFRDFHPRHRLRLIDPAQQLFPDGWPMLFQVSRKVLNRHAVHARTPFVGLDSFQCLLAVFPPADFLHQLFGDGRAPSSAETTDAS